VSERRSRPAVRVPQAAGLIARLAYAHASAAGVRVGPLLKRAGLTHHQIHDAGAFVRVRDQIEFVNLVARALGDDLLGFHLARHYDLRESGWYYYVIASAQTLLEAFQRGARCSSMVNEGVAQSCIDGKEIGLRFRYSGVGRHQDRHQIEFWTTSLLRMSRELTGVRLVPSHVSFVHLRSRGASELARFFGRDIRFGADADEVTFARRLRDLPLLNADPYLNRLLVTYCERAVTRRNRPPGSMRTKVENAIIPLLPHGNARASHVARRLGLSQRSLARHLAEEGSGFSKSLGKVRLELARRYLRDEQLSVSHVAWLLGYQDVAAFSNAFKRWTGQRPTDATRSP
jgi:AraC-like DNA-binding protein